MAARTMTLGDMRTRLEQLTDTEGDGHIGTAEKNSILNAAMAETWDLIIASGLAEKFVKSQTFNTVADQTEYVLQTICSAGDFYKISKLYVVESTNYLRPLQRISPSEIQEFRSPISAVPMKLYYIPYCPVLSSDGQSFDGVNGWEEHTIYTAAAAIKHKKDDDFNPLYRRKKELEQRIREMGETDYGEPFRVARKYRARRNPWMNYVTQINCYGLRGDKLELYYAPGYIV